MSQLQICALWTKSVKYSNLCILNLQKVLKTKFLPLKRTTAWDILGLPFWILYFFIVSYCIVPVELFSYRERLLQQNGDTGKRDGGKTTCIWVHLVQGHVCSSPSLPPPPLTPPSNAIRRAAGLRIISSPSHPSPDRFWQPHQKSRMASILEAVSMIADYGQQQWSYTNFRLSDRTLRSRDRIFEFSQELVKICGINFSLVWD